MKLSKLKNKIDYHIEYKEIKVLSCEHDAALFTKNEDEGIYLSLVQNCNFNLI